MIFVAAGILILVLILHEIERRQWADERQVLLERIQAPERVNLQPAGEPQEPLITDAPELALVGQIDDREPLEEGA